MMSNMCPSMGSKCRTFGYAWLILNGILYAIAPRVMLKLSSKMFMMGFKNADELEPREWYQDATRATGVGMIATGLAGLAFERGDEDSQADAGADEAGTAA